MNFEYDIKGYIPERLKNDYSLYYKGNFTCMRSTWIFFLDIYYILHYRQNVDFGVLGVYVYLFLFSETKIQMKTKDL